MKDNIANYYLLISRMSYKQLVYRMIKVIKFKFIYPKFGKKLFPYEVVIKDNVSKVNHFYHWGHLKKTKESEIYIRNRLREADQIYNYNFTFLNVTHTFENETIDWDMNIDEDKLWQYYLHYFEYLETLIEAYQLTGDKKYILVAQKMVDDWIDNTYPGQRNSWEAYTVSLRLVSWSHLWEVLREKDTELYNGFKERFIGSIEQQTRFLFSNLEKDLANNHYTANGKALLWVGITFPFIKDSTKYLRNGIKIMNAQLLREVRKDGSQYENSTSYQVLTAKDYLEVLIYAKKNRVALPKKFLQYTEKMFDFLMNILKPDKTLPLVNDSVKDYPINVNELLAIAAVFFNRSDFKFGSGVSSPYYLIKVYGEKGLNIYESLSSSTPAQNSIFLKGSNYGVMRNGWENGKNYLLFDAGEVGPAHNPGHAHADNLSIYIHANNEDIFIDPGTYEYKAGKKRDYYRSTKAHNTIEVENENQTTFWGPFRAGHIANSKILDVDFNSFIETISASHNGYKRLKQNVVHTREIAWDRNTVWWIRDNLTGKGSISGKLYFQVGKTCNEVRVFKRSCELVFNNSIVTLDFNTSIEMTIKKEDTWISEEWKKEISSKKITVSFYTSLPCQIDTKITVNNN